jgi:hypothetical protein
VLQRLPANYNQFLQSIKVHIGIYIKTTVNDEIKNKHIEMHKVQEDGYKMIVKANKDLSV